MRSSRCGDVIALTPTTKLRAEGCATPYGTVGLYRAVTDIHRGAGRRRVPVRGDGGHAVPGDAGGAGGAGADGGVHGAVIGASAGRPQSEDGVGQLFLLRVWEGDVELRRRRSLSLPWDPPRG